VTDAGLELAFSEGKRKTAQVSVAAPLPQNVTRRASWQRCT
jgi:hypothetical protein